MTYNETYGSDESFDMEEDIYGEIVLVSICLCFVLLCLDLLAMCYIFIRYILRLKIRSRVVILFYLFAFLTTVFRCIQTISNLTTVNRKIMDVTYDDTKNMERISASIANLFTICMGLIIVATMYKIAVSIQMLLQEVTQSERSKRKNKFYAWLLVILAFVIAEFIAVYAIPSVDIYAVYLVNIFNFAGLSVLFTLVLAFLLSKLDKMQEGGLTSERSKILRQYSVFVAAFMVGTFYYTATYCFFKPNSDLILFWFWHKIAECTMIITLTVMPVTFVLWVHSQTYNNMIIHSQIEETLTLSQYRRKERNETIIPLAAFDLVTAYESNSVAHLSGPASQGPSALDKPYLVNVIIEDEDLGKASSPNSHQTLGE